VATLFFSYSHVDENLRDQLEIHLSGLRRQSLIDSCMIAVSPPVRNSEQPSMATSTPPT